MALAFQPISLDVESGDSGGLLVLRDGKLVAVVAELGAMHGEIAGWWFIEAAFHPALPHRHDPFPDIAALDRWLRAQMMPLG